MEWQYWMTYAAGGLMLAIIAIIVILYMRAASKLTCPRCYGTGTKTINNEQLTCDWCSGKGYLTKKQLRKIQESAEIKEEAAHEQHEIHENSEVRVKHEHHGEHHTNEPQNIIGEKEQDKKKKSFDEPEEQI